ncbi:MAG: roadblock/LC7 domain-containing protein [Methanomicrobiaceae archaeon]|nr:roadblock/LC7 domain-containing protein [Methanomicrobiaceae archaeon]
MIDYLPKGKSIGAMQASLQWIVTHTFRFIGAVMITVDEGKGFILIKKGKPEAYYYQHGSKVLRAKAAYDYFSTQDLLTFRLQKYNAEEYRKAFAFYNGEQGSELTPASLDTDIPAISVKPSPEPPRPPVQAVKQTAYPLDPAVNQDEESDPAPEEAHGFVPDVRKILQSAEDSLDFSPSISEMTGKSESGDGTAPLGDDAGGVRTPEETTDRQSSGAPDLSGQQATPDERDDAAGAGEEPVTGVRQLPPAIVPGEPPTAVDERDDTTEAAEQAAPLPGAHAFTVEDSEIADLGWILRRNGVLAASVFSDGFSVMALGDADFEAVAAIAEDALRAAERIAAAMDMGTFLQMTVQMKGKNVIVAPYRDAHICFFTSPRTHLGQIRGILQELSLRNSQQGS